MVLGKGGGKHSTSECGESTSPDLHWQEEGGSDRVGGLTDYFRGMYKGDGLQGRGETPGVMVKADGS